MAHELEIKNGQAQMFSVRETPWHKLGNIVEEAPTAAEAIKLAGLNWNIKENPIAHLESLDMKANIKYVNIPKHKALVRDSDGSILAVMKNSYTVLQNQEAFNFFNPFVQAEQASFETAGSLKGGRIIWAMAKLNKAPIEVGKGDEVNKYLLLSNSHDGSISVRVGFTPVRVVCQNTLTLASNHSSSQIIKLRHSKSVKDRLDNVQEMVNAIDSQFEATAEQYKYLSSKVINKEQFEQFVKIVFKTNADQSERSKMRHDSILETISKLFENGAGAHLKSAKGTRWGAYNAVTEYLTHEHGNNEENRLHSNWYGQANNINKMAFSTLVKGL